MMKHILSLIAGAGLAAAVPLQSRATDTFFFTFGNSYTMSSFDVKGTQPTPGNPMGNPTLGTGTTGGGTNWVGDLATVNNASLILSYNLAVGGASIDNSIVKTNTEEDLTTQVGLFETNYSQKPASAPWSSDNAVFGFWIGINDIGWAYSSNEANDLVPKLMAQYKSLVEKIYAKGGRKFLFLNVPPTSRSPKMVAEGTSSVNAHAKWVTAYNNALKTMVNEFTNGHSGTTAVLYDSWTFMTKILDGPSSYGFKDASCVNEDGETCLWWDNYHPGKKYHALQAADMKQKIQSLGAW